MPTRSIVVSGKRLTEKKSGPASGQRAESSAAELRDIVGSDAPAAGGFESLDDDLSEEQKESLLLEFDAASQLLDEADVTPGVFATTENRLAALIQSALAEEAAKKGELEGDAASGFEAKFDERDVRWVFSLLTWVGKLKPHGWLPPPTQAQDLAGNSLKLAVVGDWGTGLYGAPECKSSILSSGHLDGVIHLGDIYYSGTKSEVTGNFLEHWPFIPGALNRACNGNHEMYSGGYGYFESVLPRFEQSSSCFALQNPHWLFVGLDSAYEDHDLAQGQNAWLKRLIDAAGNRKVVLFTHHQPYSHFEGGGEKLVAKLLPLLKSGRIKAWYWGHEHRCVVYDPHPQWGLYGRCIGHSGYPYFRKPSLKHKVAAAPAGKAGCVWRELEANEYTTTPRAVLLDGPNPYLKQHRDRYGPNGYIVLDFHDDVLTEHYFLADGIEIDTREIR